MKVICFGWMWVRGRQKAKGTGRGGREKDRERERGRKGERRESVFCTLWRQNFGVIISFYGKLNLVEKDLLLLNKMETVGLTKTRWEKSTWGHL